MKEVELLKEENEKLKAWLDAIVDGNQFDYARANAINQYQNYRSETEND